jgi:hypothetical protein
MLKRTMSEAENRIKELAKKIGNGKPITNEGVRTQDLVKKIRKLNEQGEEEKEIGGIGGEDGIEEPQGVEQTERVNKETPNDLAGEKERLNNALRDFNVVVDFDDEQFKVYDDLVFSSGTIDGVLEFAMKVTPNDAENGIIINYDRDDFDMQSDENNDLVASLEDYQEKVFEPYWIENIINTQRR